MKIKIKACFFICTIFVSVLVFHSKDSAAKQGKQDDTLKERIIRVPVSDMKAVTDKKPGGIFIPYNEYRDLYERAKKAFFSQKSQKHNMMTQEPLITQALIKGKYRKNLIKFQASFTIVNNREEPVQLPLPFKRVKFRRVSLNKKPVHLEERNGVLVILISEPGVHEFFAEFDTDVRFYDKKAVADFEIPKPLIGEIEIESADMADIRFPGLPMMARTPISVISGHFETDQTETDLAETDQTEIGQVMDKGGYKVSGFIGQISKISVLVRQKALRADTGQYIHSLEQHRLYISDDMVSSRLNYKINIKGPALYHLDLEIPPEVHILDISGPAISGWKRTEDIVRVDFYTPITRTTHMKIRAYHYMNPTESDLESGLATAKASYKDIKIVNLFERKGELSIYYANHIRMKIKAHTNARVLSDSDSGATSAKYPDFPDDKYTLFRQYQLFHLPAKIDFSISKPESSIFVTSRHRFEIFESKLMLNAQLTLTGFLKPVSRFDFFWAPEYFVKQAEAVINGKKTAMSHEKDKSGRHLIIETGKYAGMKDSVQFIFQAEMIRNSDIPGFISEFQKIDIPIIMFSEADKIRGRYSIFLDEKLEIEDIRVKGLTPSETVADTVTDTRNMSAPANGNRPGKFIYDFSGTANVSGVASVVRRKAHIGSQSVVYVSIDEDIIQANAFIRYNISKPGTKDFYIAVSKWEGSKINIKGPDIKEKTRITDISGSQLGNTASAEKYSDSALYEIWHVVLQKEFAGIYVLHISYQKKAESFKSFSDLPLPVPLNVGSDNGYIVIEAGSNTDIRVEKEGLNEIESYDLPKWPSYEPSRRIIESLRYFMRSFTCQIKVSAQKEMSVLSAVAQQEKIRIVIGKDSDIFFEYKYLVKNSGLQFLDMTLPAGYTLWGAEIDNKGIKPRKTGNSTMPADREGSGNLLIPLPVKNGENVFSLRLFGVIENTRNKSLWNLNTFQSITMKIPCLGSELEISYPDTWSFFTAKGNFPDMDLAAEDTVIAELSETFLGYFISYRRRGFQPSSTVREKIMPLPGDYDQMSQSEDSGIVREAPRMPRDTRISGIRGKKDSQAMGDSGRGACQKRKPEPDYVKVKGLSSLRFGFSGSDSWVRFKKNWGNADINIRFVPNGFKQFIRIPVLVLFFLVGWFLRKKGLLHPFKYLILVTVIFSLLPYAGTKHLIFVFNGAVQGAFFWWTASVFFRPEKGSVQHDLAKSAVIIFIISIIMVRPLFFMENANAENLKSFPEPEIYLPFEPPFELTGENNPVYIPTQDYFNLKFIADLIPKEVQKEEIVFDNPFDIVCMETTGQIKNNRASFVTRTDLFINRENWVMVQLPFKNIHVNEIRLDSQKVLVKKSLDTYEIPVLGKGPHEMTLIYEAEIVSLQGRRKIDFMFPEILCSEFVINLNAEDVITDIMHPESGCEIKKTVTGYEINFSGTRQNRFSMSWFPRQIADTKRTPLNFIECRVRMFMEEDHLNFSQKCMIRTEKGTPGSMTFARPRGLVVTDLVSDSVREWKTGRTDSQPVIFVVFRQEANSEKITLEIKGKKFITPGDPADVLFLKPFPAHRIHGTLEIYGNRDFRVLANNIKNLKPSFTKAPKYPPQKGNFQLPQLVGMPGGQWQMKKRFDFISPDIHAEILYQPVEKFVTGKISYEYHVLENRIYLKLAADINVRNGVIHSLCFKMPEGYTVSEIRARDISDPVTDTDEKEGQEKQRQAYIFFRHSVRGKIQIYGVFEKPLPDLSTGLSKISVEPVTIEPLDKITGSLSVFFPEGYRITQDKIRGISYAASVPGSDPGSSESDQNREDSATEKITRYDYDLKAARFKALFNAEKSDPLVDVIKVSFIKAMDSRIDVRTLCILDIRHAPLGRFLIRMPVSLKDRVSIKGDNISAVFKQEDNNGNIEIAVRFGPKTRQSDMVELSYSHYLTGSDDFFLPDISFPEAANTMEFIAVETDTSGPLKSVVRGRLYEIGKERIPALPEGARPGNILWAFRAGKAGDHSFGLRLERLETEKTVPIQILRQDIKTLIVSDGIALNEVSLKIRNRHLQFLPILFPRGSEIWSVMVAGQPVRPTAGNANKEGLKSVLIPLVRNETGERDFYVRILFALPLPCVMKTMGSLSPPMIRISDIALGKTTWTLFLPDIYTYHNFEHNMNNASWYLIEADKSLELANEFAYWTRMASNTKGELKNSSASNAYTSAQAFFTDQEEMQAQNFRSNSSKEADGDADVLISQARKLIRDNQALLADKSLQAKSELPETESDKMMKERVQLRGWQIQTQSFEDQKDVGVSISNLMKAQQDLKSKESLKRGLAESKPVVNGLVGGKMVVRKELKKEDVHEWDREKTKPDDIRTNDLYEMVEPSVAEDEIETRLGYQVRRSEAEKLVKPQKPGPVQQPVPSVHKQQALVQSMLIRGMRSMDIRIPEKGRRFHFMKLGGNPNLSVFYIEKSFYIRLGFVFLLCVIILVLISVMRRKISLGTLGK